MRRKEIYNILVLLGMVILLFCGALGLYGETYGTRGNLGDIRNNNDVETLAEKIFNLAALQAEILETKTPETPKSNKQDDLLELSTYYGSYQIKEFYPWSSLYGRQLHDVRPQEADLLLGRIIDIQPEQMITYDMGKREFTNYIIKQYIVEEPQYSGKNIVPDKTDAGLYFESDVIPNVGEDYFEQLEGVITISMEDISDGAEQRFYAFKDKNELVMYSNTMSGGVFLLEPCEEEPEEPLPEWTVQEIGELLQGVYGEYEIEEFLPTKFFPAWDYTFLDGTRANDSVAILPQEEADLMIGKTIVISEDLFVTYDNYRMPMSETAKRLEDDFWVNKVEVENPDYQVKSMRSKEIYGIRDSMLTGELVQQEYVGIDVYPGYETNGESNLPQMYLIDDGRLLLYAMGEYFLLKKVDSPESAAFDKQVDLSAWVGRYSGSSSIHISEDQPREYEIEIHEDDSGEYYADIKIDSEVWKKSVEIRADVCGNKEKISFVFKKYVSGELNFQEKQSDVLFSFRKDAGTGEIYTYWGGLNVYKETPEEICFIKE